MNKEIEVKVLNIDLKRIRAALRRAGARRVFDPTLFHEMFFKIPMRGPGFSALRLRHEKNKSSLTVKIKRDDPRFKVRDEYEVEVGDFDMTKRILECAGLRVLGDREKFREEYRVGKVKIEIDEYPGMRPYMEIETNNKRAISMFLKKMGLSFRDTTNKTSTEIIQEAGLDPKELLFKRKK